MKRYGLNKGLFWLILLALVLSFSLVTAVPVSANPDEWYVDASVDSSGDGTSWGTAFKTIGEAITTASDNDTINVAAGEYVENVEVDKQVTIIGAGAANTIVTAFNNNDHVFTVEEDNVTISGFTVTVTGVIIKGKAGIYLNEAELCNISANTCLNNYDGIYLDKSDSNTLTENFANSNAECGIYFDSSSNNTLTGNIANSNAECGIYFDSSSNNNTLTGNTANLNTRYGIYIDSSSNNNTLTGNTANLNTEYGIHLANSDSNTLTGNTANSNTEHGIHLANSDSNTLTENFANLNTRYGIYLANGSNNNTLSQNTINENGEHGIYLANSDSNTLTENTAYLNTRYGIYLDSSSDNTLTSNTANSNTEYGIYLNNGSNNNTLTSNTTNSNTEYGIYIDSSSNNTLTNNTANSNTRHGIYLANSDSNTLTENTAISNAEYGIYLDSSSDNTLTSNTAISNVKHGINLDSSSNNTLTSNTANSNTRYGIYLDNSSNSNTLTSNMVRGNNIGVKIQQSVDASTISMNFNNIYGNTNYGVDNTGGTSDVDAENNWWGDKDGPGGVGPGIGNAVSDNVDYDPWIGALVEDAKSETTSPGDDTVDAKAEADTEVDKSGAGTPTVTVAKYSGNPGTGFSGDTGKHIDVHADTTTDVDEIIIKLYYTIALTTGFVESSLILRWWDGTSWVICSDSGVTHPAGGPTYSGYMWAKIRSDTTPDLTQLTGSVFVGSGEPRERAVIPTSLLSIDILGKISRVEITNAGIIAEACTVISLEGELALEVDGGTRVICSNNQLPVLLEARPSEELPPATEGIVIVSPIYDFIAYTRGGVSQPVTFDPPARLVINYAPEAVPENTSSLFIGYYNEEQGWIQLESPSGFVAEAGEAAAQLSHFTPFAAIAELAPPSPARFEVHNLDINPSQVKTGESITISAQVANIGGTSGEYTLMLNIEGLMETSQVIELAPGESREISFTITLSSPDSYGVEIGGLRGNFVAVPISPPEVSEPEAGVPGAVNYGWLIAVIPAVAALAVLAFIMARKRVQHAPGLERAWFEKPAKPFTTAGRRLRRAPLVEEPAEVAPGTLRVYNLKITPNPVRPNGIITVFAEVTNTGPVTSSYSLVLKIKGIAEAVKEITLNPGQSQKVAFMILKDKPGVYDVDLEDLKGSFTVED